MNIFIIGNTKSGKTTLAKLFKDANHIEASYDLKSKFPINYGESLQKYTNRLTNEAVKVLNKTPYYFSRHIKQNLVTDRTNVISGVRNINDFIELFDKTHDKVYYLKSKPLTGFEKYGTKAILSYLKFNELIDNKQYIFFK